VHDVKSVSQPDIAVIFKQLLAANDINRFRRVVLDLLQDGACTDFFENLSEYSLKGDLSNVTTFNPPHFSLVDTFNVERNGYLSRKMYMYNLYILHIVQISFLSCVKQITLKKPIRRCFSVHQQTPAIATSINDTGGKFATSFNDTGGN
jgi:hypothetical protein